MTRGDQTLVRRSGDLLLLSVVMLLAIGLVMLASTSVFGAHARADDPYFDVRKQLFWVVSGLVLLAALAFVDYRWLADTAWGFYALSILLLVACFVPGVGLEINGERRWIQFMGKSIQPSEFAKLSAVLMLAWCYQFGKPERGCWHGVIQPALLAATTILLIALEKDLGTAMVLAIALAAVLFIAGVRFVWLLLGAGLGVAGFALLVWVSPDRWQRIQAMFSPENFERSVGLQQKIAQLAFGSGGVEGVGLGAGRMKMHYLPYAHTDFIFPVVGEELGLGASIAIVLGFTTFTLAGLMIAMRAPDTFGLLLGTGLVLCVGIQGAVNIAVTTGLFPNTGLPLPFVSYGGSNLVCSLISVGILLSIHRQANLVKKREQLPIKQDWLTAGL